MGSESTATVKIPSKTWWEMRRLKYNIIVGCIGILIILDLNLYIKKGASFDAVFFFTSIAVGVIYAILCNLTYTLLWMLDNLSFGNDLVDFQSPKRTLILYLFVFLSCMVPFGILHLVKDLL
ncbi:MAG: hypothetical protein IT271_01955 [Chitinophagales bacterium]|nr:hypothetical protein [Chitinophagales bacterium]